MTPLPFDAALQHYEAQAAELLAALQAGHPDALRVFHENHPRFLDSEVRWLPLRIPDSAIQEAGLNAGDAQLALARAYCFRDWPALAAHAASMLDRDSAAYRFESAVEAVVNGDLAALRALLAADRGLVHARSARVTNFDPPIHGATLLHYLAANGVEGYRQKTPPNAVAVAEMLLIEGADPNSLAGLYGGQCSTMSLLVSSSHPAAAGLQVALVDKLVDHGASVERLGDGHWTSPVMTALVFGFRDAAEALVRRGAAVRELPEAAGLGQIDDLVRMLPGANAAARHRALAIAAQLGHEAIVRVLLEAGEDPSRYNPAAMHAHATPIHHAAHAGHLGVVRLLAEAGARLDLADKIWKATPLGWARHGNREAVAAYLASRGAPS